MKGISKLAIIVVAFFALTIVVASYHFHSTSSEHFNCKLCKISVQPSHFATPAKTISGFVELGFLSEHEFIIACSETTDLTSDRAPPTTIL